ncbi:MAG: hypothetical protein GX053_11920 [Tissierella sp.]|nr:hypothetical protein [Tissierella sp.]
MNRYKKMMTPILSAIFGFLVGTYTKDIFSATLILLITFLLVFIFKKMIIKE